MSDRKPLDEFLDLATAVLKGRVAEARAIAIVRDRAQTRWPSDFARQAVEEEKTPPPLVPILAEVTKGRSTIEDAFRTYVEGSRMKTAGPGRAHSKSAPASSGGLSEPLAIDSAFLDDSCPAPAPAKHRLTPISETLKTLGKYTIEMEIGRGGMGIVYRARQAGLERRVALKVLISGRDASGDEIERFLREAKAAAHVQHDHLVAIHEVGQEGDLYYISMEYIEGPSLSSLVRKAPLEPRRAALLVRDAARGLAAAHQAGILHRDIKPSNILVAAGDRAKVTDFGLAKTVEGGRTLTQSGAMLGTPVYMPPEQAESAFDRMGPWSDVYSLGATLYEALSGMPPYDPTGLPAQVVARTMLRDPKPLAKAAPDVPADLRTIVLVAMDREPSRRYRDAGALADDLDRFLQAEPIRARPPGRARRLVLWTRRRPALALASALLVVAATFGATVLGGTISRNVRAASAAARGDGELDRGEFGAAIRSYDEALALVADHPGAKRGRQSAIDRLVEESRARLAEGRFSEAIASANGALEADPGSTAARRARLAIVREMAGKATGGLEAGGQPRDAEAILALLRALPGLSPEEAKSIETISGAIGGRRSAESSIDAEIDEASKMALEKPDLAAVSLAKALGRLEMASLDDTENAGRRSRIVEATRLIHRRVIERSADFEREPDPLLADIRTLVVASAGAAEADTWFNDSSEVTIDLLPVAASGDTSPLDVFTVHAYPLRDGSWSGDQEANVERLLAGPGLDGTSRLAPGYYLFVARVEGHLDARFLLPVQSRVRLTVQVRLYRAFDCGIALCSVPSFHATIEDALEPPAPLDTPRGQQIAMYRDQYARYADEPDFFAARTELTNADLRRIYSSRKPDADGLVGWDRQTSTFPDSDGLLPARGMNQPEAYRIRDEATRRLLPEELRGRWEFALPTTTGSPLGTRLRLFCGRDTDKMANDFFYEEMLQRKDSRRSWPRVAFGNQGTKSVAPVGTYTADVSIHGLRDLEGNVSEWTHGNMGHDEEGHAMGGNFQFEPLVWNEVLSVLPAHRAPYLGMRLLLVPVTGQERESPVRETPIGLDSSATNELALTFFRGDPTHAIPADPLGARRVLETYLKSHPGDPTTLLNLALMALSQQSWKTAIDRAGQAVQTARGDSALLARYIRIWATVWDDRLSEDPPDIGPALGDLDFLVENRPTNSIPRLVRAYLYFMRGNLAAACFDLDAFLPGVFRATRFARQLGWTAIDEALSSNDSKGVFEQVLSRWLAAMVDVPDLGPSVLPMDAEFLGGAMPRGSSHNEQADKKFEEVLQQNLNPGAMFSIAGETARPGETPIDTIVRILGLLAKLMALAGDRDQALSFAKMAEMFPPGGAPALALRADLDLFWNEVESAGKNYEAALAASPGHPDALLGLAWCALLESRRAEGSERETQMAQARRQIELARAAGALDAPVYAAVVDLEEGRLAEARRTLLECETAAPEDAAVHLYLFEVSRREGDFESARAALARARAVQTIYRPFADMLEEGITSQDGSPPEDR
ncbi:MAG: protein kinase [Planctomycetes bacterium]|nr:protein kinase [Planctomycetota bacterium]